VLPIRPNGDRPSLHLLGANLTYSLDDVPWDALASATHLHMGAPELIGADVAAAILRRAKEHGVVTSADLVAPGGELGNLDMIAAALPYIDYLLPNDEQVLGFTGGAGVVAATAAGTGALSRDRRQSAGPRRRVGGVDW
jgi:sugar/nucleoside kinase (ribokinase family)